MGLDRKRKCLKERPDQCHFFIEKKQRRCAMQRKADHKFCSEHLLFDETNKDKRVPCPLDNKHTVWTKELDRHLKKCNAKPREVKEPWFHQDLNWIHGDNLCDSQDTPLDHKHLYDKYIPILSKLNFPPLELKQIHHDGLNGRMSELKNQKHAIQQSSLIANMKSHGLLNKDNFYVEFGCGKGELSRFVNTCILEEIREGKEKEKEKENKDTTTVSTYGYGFIDRGVNRMKMDSKISKDALELNISPIVKRSRIDIKDLDLDEFVRDVNPKSIVGISKHLCGVATDLTLKLLFNSKVIENSTFSGMLIAMCCRHVCDYEQLMPESREYLKEKGFATKESFNTLKRIVSWAVCGTRDKNENSEKGNEASEKADKVSEEENKVSDKVSDKKESREQTQALSGPHITGLDYQSRENLGFIARRLIDESRVHALKQALHHYNIQMFWYTDKEVTLENVCLCITKSYTC